MAKVWNDSKYHLTCTQIGKEIRGGHFITVSDEQAALVPQTGVFRVEFDKPPSKRKVKDPDAKSEDTGGKIPGTVFFAGGPSAKG